MTRQALVCLALVLLTAAVFFPVRHCGFVNFDDPEYVTQNFHVQSGLTPAGIVWAFTHTRAANWHPVTWLSHMLDCQIFGLNPGGHHLVNLVFHLANTLLLFLLLDRWTGALWRSAVVAGLFALHPLHVESVAWIAERKDVLSTFFGLLTLRAYASYVSHRAGPAMRSYLLSLFFFALGLMSKPMLVTLPFVMLLLDYWPLERLSRGEGRGASEPAPSAPGSRLSPLGRLVLEKWPFFLLAAVVCVTTFIAQKSGGAVATFGQIPFAARAENALVSYIRYIGKMVYPADLAVMYPYPADLNLWPVIGAGVLLLALTFWLFRQAARRPYLAVGWLWFLGTLVPVIGLVQVGAQSMADRYTYIPLTGLFILLVWTVADWAENSFLKRLAAGVLATTVLAACATVSVVQLRYWQDSVALFQHALTVTRDNAVARNNLASALASLGQRDAAMFHYAEAARLNPSSPLVQNNFGVALARYGQADLALQHYDRALALNPDYAEAYNNRGVALFSENRGAEAVTNFERALSLNPDYPEARNNLGGALMQAGKTEAAAQQFNLALQLNPKSSEAHFNLALCLARAGHNAEAITHFSDAVRLDPASIGSHYQLGLAFLRQGRVDAAADQFAEVTRRQPGDAPAQFNLGMARVQLEKIPDGIEHLRKAVELRPDWPDALNGLAWVLATQPDDRYRDGPEALRCARQAAELTGEKQPVILNTLAAAYAETGQFDEATNTARKALELARQTGQTRLTQTIEHALRSYEARQPFRTAALW